VGVPGVIGEGDYVRVRLPCDSVDQVVLGEHVPTDQAWTLPHAEARGDPSHPVVLEFRVDGLYVVPVGEDPALAFRPRGRVTEIMGLAARHHGQRVHIVVAVRVLREGGDRKGF
jgi:hypothetical protein